MSLNKTIFAVLLLAITAFGQEIIGGGNGGAGSTPCVVTQSSTTISIFATASASTPCLIPIGSTGGQTFTAPITVTLPSGSDSWFVGLIPAGTVSVGANSATATCAGCTGGVTQTGITTMAGLNADVVPLAIFSSVSTSFTSVGNKQGSIPGSFPTAAGTGLNKTNSGVVVTYSMADTAVVPGAYTCTSATFDQQGRATAAASGVCGGITPPTANFTPVSSPAGGSQQTATSYVLPANSFSANNKFLTLVLWWHCAGVASSSSVQIKFGATVVTALPNCTLTTPTTTTCYMGRSTGASAESSACSTLFQRNLATYPETATMAENTTGAITIAILTTNGTSAAGDIVIDGFIIIPGNW